MILQAIPVLYTANIKATIQFYENSLGFKAVSYGSYIVMRKGGAELHFIFCSAENLYNNTACCIKVNDVQCLFSEMAAKDIMYAENKLLDLPGCKKGFTIKDNNGILLHFIEHN